MCSGKVLDRFGSNIGLSRLPESFQKNTLKKLFLPHPKYSSTQYSKSSSLFDSVLILPFILCRNTFLGSVRSDAYNMCPSLEVGEQASQSYKTSDTPIVCN